MFAYNKSRFFLAKWFFCPNLKNGPYKDKDNIRYKYL